MATLTAVQVSSGSRQDDGIASSVCGSVGRWCHLLIVVEHDVAETGVAMQRQHHFAIAAVKAVFRLRKWRRLLTGHGDGGRNDAQSARTQNATHLGERADRILPEIDDIDRKHPVETSVRARDCFRM